LRAVEVVCRLVEQDVVGTADEDLRQRDAHLPAAGEGAALFLAVARCEAEAIKHAADALVDAVAVEALELFEQPSLFFDEGIEVSAAPLDLAGDLVDRVVDRLRLREGGPHLVGEGAVGPEASLLAQIAERATATDTAGTQIGLFVAGEQLEQRRFAGTVGADEAGSLAVADDERDAVEHIDGAEGFCDVVRVEHVRSA